MTFFIVFPKISVNEILTYTSHDNRANVKGHENDATTRILPLKHTNVFEGLKKAPCHKSNPKEIHTENKKYNFEWCPLFTADYHSPVTIHRLTALLARFFALEVIS